MSYSWPQSNKTDLQARLYKEYFHSKLNAEPGKSLVALYMKNNTHKKACHRFHQLLFQDISSNLCNDFVFFKFDVTKFEDRENLLYYMSQCWLNSDFAQVVRKLGTNTHSMLVLMTKDGKVVSLMQDNANFLEVIYNMLKSVNDTCLSTSCRMVQPTTKSFTKNKTSVPFGFLPLNKVKNDDAIPKVNNVQNSHQIVNDSLRRDESLVINFSTENFAKEPVCTSTASPAVEQNFVADKTEPETAGNNEEVLIAEPQQTTISIETDPQVVSASEKVLELKAEVVTVKMKNKPQNVCTASQVIQQPNGKKKSKNKKKIVSVDMNNEFSILAKLYEDVLDSKITTKAKQFEESVFQTSESLTLKEKLTNCENLKDPSQLVYPLNLPLETQTKVDASKQESRGTELVIAETEPQRSTVSSCVLKKKNARKNARRKANKWKRLSEARQEKQLGWSVVEKNKPRKSKPAFEVTQPPKEEPKNKKKVVPVDKNNKFSILNKLDEDVKASKTTKKAKQFEKVFHTSESLIVKEKLTNCENVKDPKQSVYPLNLPLETQTEVDASKQESREADFVTAETEYSCLTVSSNVSTNNNASRETNTQNEDGDRQDKQDGWCVVS